MIATRMPADEVTNLIVGSVSVLFGALVMLVIIPQGIDNPGNISVRALGPAFWPSIIASLIMLLGVLVCVQAYLRTRALDAQVEPVEVGSEVSVFAWVHWLTALFLLAALYAGLHLIGMVLSCILALIFFPVLGGERRILIVATMAFVLPLGLYAFFRYAANVFIPVGVLEPLLG